MMVVHWVDKKDDKKVADWVVLMVVRWVVSMVVRKDTSSVGKMAVA